MAIQYTVELFLNDTSELMANIIKDELHKSAHLEDENFKIISPYTLNKTMEGEKKHGNLRICL